MNKNKYIVLKRYNNDDTTYAMTVYANTAKEAKEKAIKYYSWNNWLYGDNTIVEKAGINA